jgi:hypothetical protein
LAFIMNPNNFACQPYCRFGCLTRGKIFGFHSRQSNARLIFAEPSDGPSLKEEYGAGRWTPLFKKNILLLARFRVIFIPKNRVGRTLQTWKRFSRWDISRWDLSLLKYCFRSRQRWNRRHEIWW